MSNQDNQKEDLLGDDVQYFPELIAYENPDQFDTADAVVEGEMEVELLDPDHLDEEEAQWYAAELRRTCGDDVAAEELSCLTGEIFVL